MLTSIRALIPAISVAILIALPTAGEAASRFCRTSDLAGEWRHHLFRDAEPGGEAREFHIFVSRRGVITRVREWSPEDGRFFDRDDSDWAISINRFCTVEYFAEFGGGLCSLRGYMNPARDHVSGTGVCNQEEPPTAAFWTLTKRAP